MFKLCTNKNRMYLYQSTLTKIHYWNMVNAVLRNSHLKCMNCEYKLFDQICESRYMATSKLENVNCVDIIHVTEKTLRVRLKIPQFKSENLSHIK